MSCEISFWHHRTRKDCSDEDFFPIPSFHHLVRAIAYQQLTAKAADAMIDRLKDRAGSVFPTPAQIVVAFGPGELRACGFSATKAATIQVIAQGALGGEVPTRAAADQMDDEALITRLLSIKGAGRWTVEMLLMYSLERMDVSPASDFGVREGLPHRIVVAWYLWRIPRSSGQAPA
jgi:DNA-3-methyladenine glycosylase II